MLFKKAYTPSKPDTRLKNFTFGGARILTILAALAAVALSFIYSIYTLDKENIKNNTSINNKIDIFMRDSNTKT